jgi:cold shock protein
MQGKIKKTIDHRGFGFIEVEGQDDDLFFHRSQITSPLVFEELKDGQAVEFEIEDTKRGPQAVKISNP